MSRFRHVLIAALREQGPRVVAAGLTVIVIGGMTASGWTDGPRSKLNATTSAVAPRTDAVDVELAEVQADIASAMDKAAAIEPKLEYAEAKFTSYIVELSTTPEVSPDDQIRAANEQASADGSDAVAALVLRNLPEQATFSQGSPAGPGIWVMAAGDPNILLETMQNGFETPVVADVEMIAGSGRSLGALRLPLQATPEAAEAPGPAKKSAEIAAEEPNDGEPKKVKPRQTNRNKFARVEPRKKRRILKAPPADEGSTQDQASAVADASEQEKPGMMSKFFSWLTSGKKDEINEDDGIRRGLGRRPDE